MQDQRSNRRSLLRAAAVTAAGSAVAAPALGGITPAQAAGLAASGAIPWVGKAGSGAPFIADDAVGAQAAINAALGSGAQQAVYVAPGEYLVKGPVVLYGRQALIGAGPMATVLKATTGFSGTALVTTPAGAYTHSRQCVTDIGLEGANLAANGINFQMNADPTTYGPDPAPWLTRVFVSRTTGDGIYLGGTYAGGMREFKLTDCRVENAGGWGYNLQSSDGFVSGCSCQGSDAGGYLIGGGNIKVWGSKVYGTGTATTAGPGFRLASSRATVVGCEAQDVAGNGFEIVGANCTISGCTADSTGWGTAAGATDLNSAGFHVAGSAASIEGGSFQRANGGPRWVLGVGANVAGMRTALYLASGVNYVSVRLVTGANKPAPFQRLITGTAGANSSISVLG
ncbi:glycoside hydrolase family 55 protein [Micromonospora sp. PLK6-60]|uniref:right-handed parallel beta-helix repeat-containing protein n=1 Tax=Micromonospora sp. PLK6-60 TaxID=2873383 RepID=UPI001CA79D54|nr:glycosyl hydrolase family 28-related protein [Micromonospora sp. PLK6-60]MBY8872866.1 glycoside hydrolase family 55 protein [Micromonospora sp. PLK6-60]